MAGPTFDTFTVSDISYSGTTLTMVIQNDTYGMKNPTFTIGSDSGDITTDRSGYLTNPYTLTVTGITLTAGNTYNLSIFYNDNSDMGITVSASGTFTIPGESSSSKIVQFVNNEDEKIYPIGISGLSDNAEWFTVILEGNKETTVTSKNGNSYTFKPWDEGFGDNLAAGWYLSSASDKMLFAEVTSSLELISSEDTNNSDLYVIGCDNSATIYNRNLGRRNFIDAFVTPYDEYVTATSSAQAFRSLEGRRSYPGTYTLSYSVLPGWSWSSAKTWIFQGKMAALVYNGSTPLMYSDNFDFECRTTDRFMPALAIGLGNTQKKSTSRTVYRILERKNV